MSCLKLQAHKTGLPDDWGLPDNWGSDLEVLEHAAEPRDSAELVKPMPYSEVFLIANT